MSSEPHNPFAPPEADDSTGVDLGRGSDDVVLATRGERLAAAVIDTVVMVLSLLPAFVLGALGSDQDLGEAAIIGVVVLFCVQSVVQWVLITTRGQTVGKIILRIRIEHMDGTPVNFFTGVLLRNWILGLANAVIGVIGIIDVMFIFGAEQRCLHDLIANTRVVMVAAES